MRPHVYGDIIYFRVVVTTQDKTYKDHYMYFEDKLGDFDVFFERPVYMGDMSLLGNTKRGADGFGSTGGITKIIILDDSDSEIKSDSENKMQNLPTRKVITQGD